MENGVAKVSEILWTQGQYHTPSIPEMIEKESDQIFTIFIFVITAILCVAVLFIIAMFFDCRKPKVPIYRRKSKILKFRLPIPLVGGTIQEEDEDTIINDRTESVV
ncbi:unnamed protein product [Acanthoscelides obtectus]|uniref:Uncharacterized protein n=1 Tax=Acanthoscelides obtectus TaxID=200917 RepID=A0A9P0P2V9_ACAOB|nr:unnamed protein product [Acanthoscelides obtectus]CAK1626795.1 hypothetical protein AOBTE_LOCUS4082 [Acanthoscelides obtectus]